jgi:hypothetical protein
MPLIPISLPLLDSKIKHFTDTYHTTTMRYVAYTEVVVILARIVIGILL